jgi:tRNA pseudouridine38-40 synthase
VAYDGAAFHGFAPNPGVTTVAGALHDALARITGGEVALTGAGRTDAGVHAWGQVVSVDLPADVDIDGLARRLTRMCAPSIVVREAAWAAPDFDARFSAVWRHYRYSVLNEPVPDPFLAATTWHVAQPLDLRLMQLGCDPLIGEHDFTSFCRAPKVPAGQPAPSAVRRVLLARWSETWSERAGRVLRFDIRANAFCHQMVRSIVGTLVDVGLGRLHAGELRGRLQARDRRAAGQVAPPHGLCLWEVGYAGEGPG